MIPPNGGAKQHGALSHMSFTCECIYLDSCSQDDAACDTPSIAHGSSDEHAAPSRQSDNHPSVQTIIPVGLVRERHGQHAEVEQKVDRCISPHVAQSDTRAVNVTTLVVATTTCQSPSNTSKTDLSERANFAKLLSDADTSQQKIFWIEHLLVRRCCEGGCLREIHYTRSMHNLKRQIHFERISIMKKIHLGMNTDEVQELFMQLEENEHDGIAELLAADARYQIVLNALCDIATDLHYKQKYPDGFTKQEKKKRKNEATNDLKASLVECATNRLLHLQDQSGPFLEEMIESCKKNNDKAAIRALSKVQLKLMTLGPSVSSGLMYQHRRRRETQQKRSKATCPSRPVLAAI